MRRKNIVRNSPELAQAIKNRRNELHLSQKDAADIAGVSAATWGRFEAGYSFQKDKIKEICKALDWSGLPSKKALAALTQDNKDEMPDVPPVNTTERPTVVTEKPQLSSPLESIEKSGEDHSAAGPAASESDTSGRMQHTSWLQFIADEYGQQTAHAFRRGVGLLSQYIREDMAALSWMPRGSHIGEIRDESRFLAYHFPEQFLTNCTYEVLYAMRADLQTIADRAENMPQLYAYTVMEELVLYLISRAAGTTAKNKSEYTDEWLYDTLGDTDILICLYSGFNIDEDNVYHFSHWMEQVFWTGNTPSLKDDVGDGDDTDDTRDSSDGSDSSDRSPVGDGSVSDKVLLARVLRSLSDLIESM